ncbi:MAG: hypothetical protein P8J70_13505 [Glaciecola sp.]|nr:hypothetical protein [Glaciecola sp.]MDG1814971.1 hypothetical protein [Glaciecola sp.]MDG2100673.1 hypothetical protein [Glaciecola sp.]
MSANQALHQIYSINTLQYGGSQDPATNRGAKWQYLLSDSIKFAQDMTSGIRIQKPNKQLVFPWVMKIISRGQCQSLYIENHQFSHVQTALIQKAAQQFQVNVTVLDVIQDTDNVIVGPW